MGRGAHLVRRFVGSLRPGPPRRAESAWAEARLIPAELELWRRLSNADRRHSVRVAHRVEQLLTDTDARGDHRWLAAAMLHDVGKLDARLGTLGRVGATLAGAAAGHDKAERWSTRRGVTRRVGCYLRHPELGETRLRLAGARDEVARWAGAHHDPGKRERLDFPGYVVAALLEADDD